MKKIADNIRTEELVSRDVYKKFGEKSIWLMDKRIIDISEWLRNYFESSLMLNSWHEGGRIEHAGFRGPDCKISSLYSQHRYGRALDFNIVGYNPEAIRNFIRMQFAELRKLGLTTMQSDTPYWVHIDCRNTGINNLMEVSFKNPCAH